MKTVLITLNDELQIIVQANGVQDGREVLEMIASGLSAVLKQERREEQSKENKSRIHLPPGVLPPQ